MKIMSHAGPAFKTGAIDAANGEIAVAATVFGDASLVGLAPSGRDVTTIARIQQTSHANYYKVSFATLSLPMCPSLILICAQKDVDCYNHANNATGAAADIR